MVTPDRLPQQVDAVLPTNYSLEQLASDVFFAGFGMSATNSREQRSQFSHFPPQKRRRTS
jgi:hypothetical protein